MPELLPPDGFPDQSAVPSPTAPMKRRTFLRAAGATAGVATLALAGCSKEEEKPAAPAVTTVDVGAADAGVMNYAYALEQLEAAFYKAVRAGAYYAGLAATSAEKQLIDDLEKHEIVHVRFLQALLAKSQPIRDLETDFSAIDFATRLSPPGAARLGVLNAAMLFEDLGVAAYNGAARFLTTPVNVLTLGKIVSVEARHAALIRDLISYNSFVGSDIVEVFAPGSSGLPGEGTGTGLELTKTPAQVLDLVNPYLKEGSKLTATQLV